MDYRLDLGVWNGVFVVPNILTDRYLRSANESQLKFILYLLRHPNRIFDEEIVCTETGINGEDYKKAFDYWNEKGLLKIDGDKVVPAKEEEEPKAVKKIDIAKETVKIEETVDEDKPEQDKKPQEEAHQTQGERIEALRRVAVNSVPSAIDPYYASDRINSDPKLLELVRWVEATLGGKMTGQLQGIIVSCVDDYCMERECVMMLFSYCLKNGSANVSYLNKVAKEWADSGIITYKAAEKRAKELEKENLDWRRVSRIFGIEKREPGKREKSYVNTWINEWYMSDELLSEAYSRCVDTINKVSWSYINKILKKWHDKGYISLSEVESGESKTYEIKKKNESSYDINELSSLTSYNNMTEEEEKALVEKYKALAEKEN